MHQVAEFLSFIVGLVVTILKWLYASIANLLPAAVWAAVAAALLALILYVRLAARIENLETALELLNGKLDTILSHSRPRTNPDPRDPDAKSRT